MKLTDLKRKAREMFTLHGLEGWTFAFDRSLQRFGVCKSKTKSITMSRSLVKMNDEARCLNTLLHEIAHALVGAGNGHNGIWREKAVSIGCNGERCYSSASVVSVAKKWQAFCMSCNQSVGFYHRRRNLSHTKCRRALALHLGKIVYKEA